MQEWKENDKRRKTTKKRRENRKSERFCWTLRAADTIITTALAIVVGKCISNGNEGNGDDKDNFFGL